MQKTDKQRKRESSRGKEEALWSLPGLPNAQGTGTRTPTQTDTHILTHTYPHTFAHIHPQVHNTLILSHTDL